MNVASQELSLKLEKLSGWKDTAYQWTNSMPDGKWHTVGRPPADSYMPKGDWHAAYDAHYLFDKLLGNISPTFILQSDNRILVSYDDPNMREHNLFADSVEDGLAMVAIEVIEKGDLPV